jgi:hypothetical protein
VWQRCLAFRASEGSNTFETYKRMIQAGSVAAPMRNLLGAPLIMQFEYGHPVNYNVTTDKNRRTEVQ